MPLIDAAPSHDNVSRASRVLALALLALGDSDGAHAEAQRLLAHAESGRNEHVEAIAYHLLGRAALARGAALEAEGHLHAALAIGARRDFRVLTIDNLESLADVAFRTDSPAEAARLLAAVRAAREDLGLVRWPPEPERWSRVEGGVRAALGEEPASTAEAEGRAMSVDDAVEYATRARGERKRPSHGWESLTPTEVEVIGHAAAGLTNPQIGERMFISRGTVKAHLSHIFAKLGISSRTELAAAVTKRGLGAPGRLAERADPPHL